MSTPRDDLRVGDVLLPLDRIPVVKPTTLLKTTLETMAKFRLGVAAIIDEDGLLLGIFTDGDLRRLFQGRDDFTGLLVEEVMHPGPQTISPDKLATEALKQMQQS